MASDFNPILNIPFDEPKKHYRTLPDGSLDYEKIINGRRAFMPEMPPIPLTASSQSQMFDLSHFGHEPEKNIVNIIREEVKLWRNKKYPGTTSVTKELLDFWFLNEERPAKIFFAQREAVETAVWLNEIAPGYNAGSNIINIVKSSSSVISQDPDMILPRIAFKMATGTGKTIVMAMIILYNYFNRSRYSSDTRFADNFLIVTPGVTVKERLNVLYSDSRFRIGSDYTDYYKLFNLVPGNLFGLLDNLNTKLLITNYHVFEPRAFKGNKKSPFDGKFGTDKSESKENFNLVIKRVTGKFKTGSRLLIINDEAHHCYLPISAKKSKRKVNEDEVDESERAAVWYRGLTEIKKRYKVANVYDLSATPYFLTGSGYPAYTLFPWVVSDFGLVEAIESGLVKIPFIPESDPTHNLDMPTLRNLYEHVRDDLPKKGKKKARADKELNEKNPVIPSLIKNALDQFYSNYKKDYDKYRGLFDNPPVFIIVCNNTTVSSEIFKYVAGYEITDDEGNISVVHGKFDLFDNFDHTSGRSLNKPPSLLIDSDALENSEQIDESFKKVFTPEIENFKKEYRIIHPERSVENITEAEILREVVNTVGKKGKLGSHVRCIVSVSMLTEGWDANTVTHIMGIRAFGSQLLCEQVAGRALRRVNYDSFDKHGRFTPEYAQIIGVPFNMFKKGAGVTPEPPQNITNIFPLPERKNKFEITFPNVVGYRFETEQSFIRADFSHIEPYELDGTKYPAYTIMSNAFSPHKEKLTLDQIKDKRFKELVFVLTRQLIALKFSDDDGRPKFQYFNSLKQIVESWLTTKVKLIGDAFLNMLFYENENKVCDHIMLGIQAAMDNKEKIVPVLNFYDKFGSTKFVNGRTSKNVYPTKKSHVNFVVADTESWEQIAAKTLEEIPQVLAYVKNSFLGFKIPYVHPEKDNPFYYPDFIAVCKTPKGKKINLIIEITGMNKDKTEKKWYTENRWLPSVNNVKEIYGYDEWRFIEIAEDIRDVKNKLVKTISE